MNLPFFVIMNSNMDDNSVISKERLLTAICLVMTLEHKTIELQELIKATGMSFEEVRKSMHNLSMLKLVEIEPTFRGVPYFSIINQDESRKFLKLIGF